MSDKQPMQAAGGKDVANDDGVAHPATEGESQGGAYANPHKNSDKGGFDGGQTHKEYEGPANPNSTTEPE